MYREELLQRNLLGFHVNVIKKTFTDRVEQYVEASSHKFIKYKGCSIEMRISMRGGLEDCYYLVPEVPRNEFTIPIFQIVYANSFNETMPLIESKKIQTYLYRNRLHQIGAFIHVFEISDFEKTIKACKTWIDNYRSVVPEGFNALDNEREKAKKKPKIAEFIKKMKLGLDRGNPNVRLSKRTGEVIFNFETGGNDHLNYLDFEEAEKQMKKAALI